jgi:hypothetical protein
MAHVIYILCRIMRGNLYLRLQRQSNSNHDCFSSPYHKEKGKLIKIVKVIQFMHSDVNDEIIFSFNNSCVMQCKTNIT